MGLEKVIDRITREGDEKIRTILLDAEKEAADLLHQTQTTMEKLLTTKRQETDLQIQMQKTQEFSSIEIEVKKIQLIAEKEILETTYRECLQALEELSHEQVLLALLKQIPKELPDAEVIYSNKRDERYILSKSSYKFAGTIDCIGGFIAENHDKTMKLDYRYEKLADMVWDHSLKEIAKKLFRGSEK